MDIKELGLTQEQLRELVVERLCNQFLGGSEDSDGNIYQSKLAEQIEKKVAERIVAEIDKIAKKHVLPNVVKYIEALCLQETNKWGEAKKEKITFVEFLVQKAETYLTEKVDFEGKTKEEGRSYSWNGTQTRISHLVHQHLHYAVENSMKEAVKNANAVIVKGLEETVKIKLAEIANQLKVNVVTK
jgi:hypothetical protein